MTDIDLVQKNVDKLENRINGNLERLWTEVTAIKDLLATRLPTWATFLFMALTGVVSALLTSLWK